MDAITVDRPADVIAALPSILGFPPIRSVLVLCLDAPRRSEGATVARLGLVARQDLPDGHDCTDVVRVFAELCGRHEVPSVGIVIVDDRGTAARPHPHLVAALRTSLAEVGTDVTHAWCATSIAAGARWGDYETGEGGTLPDPGASAVAAAHAVAGRVTHADRSALATIFAPRTVALPDLIEALVMSGTGPAVDADQFATVRRAVADHAAGRTLDPADLTRLAVALGNPTVRDACFGLTSGEHSDSAAALWVHLTQVLPSPHRAHAAVLAAYRFYLRGEGTIAGAALDIAREEDPDNLMAALLDTALRAGLAPGAVASLGESGATCAAALTAQVDVG